MTNASASRISILMPCYNAAPFVADALDSVLAQTWPNLEVIVVDDGSTDGSAAILSKYSGRGIQLIQQKNAGQCAAANRAFAASTGDYIKFFDADDIMATDMVERQIARLGGQREAIALSEWARFWGSDHTEAIFQPLPMYRDATPADWLATEWQNALPMMQCGLWLIPRGVLDRSGLWDARLSLQNDFEFFTRVLLSASKILYAPEARIYYRSGLSNSLSGQKYRNAIESAFLSAMLGTQHLLDVEDSPRTRRACANILMSFEYNHYPAHGDLRARIRARVAELGGSDLVPDGPPGFHKVRRWLGWRAARRIQRISEKLEHNNPFRAEQGDD